MISPFRILATSLVLTGCGRVGYEAPTLSSEFDASFPADASFPTDADPGTGLIHRGALARYFLRDGVGSGAAIPAVGNLPLPIIDGDTIETDERATGSGLRFNVVGDNARACAPIAQTSVSGLEGVPPEPSKWSPTSLPETPLAAGWRDSESDSSGRLPSVTVQWTRVSSSR